MIEKFLNKDISQPGWKEWQIQAYLVMQARRAGYFIEGDQNAAKRGYAAAAIAKACGMTPGTPDLRILFPYGRILFVEVKTDTGRLSKAQLYWHEKAAALGHNVLVVKADTPKAAWEIVNQKLTSL